MERSPLTASGIAMKRFASISYASSTATPDVSVVVCTFNRADLLAQTLTSLLQQQTHGKSYEIVVVDDGSTDSTPEVVETVRRKSAIELLYVRQENAGIGHARNRGVRAARAPWIAFLDDDEVANKGWLKELLTTAELSGADCVGGPCILRMIGPTKIEPVGTVSMLLGQNPTMMGRAAMLSRFERLRFQLARMALPGGGNVLVRKTLIGELGGFRPLKYGEDLDFFRRAKQRRARFAISDRATIYHLTPPERLAPAYLYAYAKRGGATLAAIDQSDYGRGRPYFIAFLRLAHMILATFPALVWHALWCHKSSVVSRRCSLQFASAYIRHILRRA